MTEEKPNESSDTISTNNADSNNGQSNSTKSVVTDSSRGLLGPIFRGLGYGAGIAGAFAIALNAQFGDQIKAYFDDTKEKQYLAATIEQQSNEQKRNNQLFEQQQKTLEGMRVDQEFSRKLAIQQREELTEKLDIVIAENKIEKAERLKIKKELEITSSNTNQLTIDLRKCREDCKRK